MNATRVVVNDEDQYSIWPAEAPMPDGWRAEGFSGSREECLAHIDVAWTDMRPRSVREASARQAMEDSEPRHG